MLLSKAMPHLIEIQMIQSMVNNMAISLIAIRVCLVRAQTPEINLQLNVIVTLWLKCKGDDEVMVQQQQQQLQ